jgi:hypothetical protein
MSDYNPITKLMVLDAKLSKLKGGEIMNSNNDRSIIESLST